MRSACAGTAALLLAIGAGVASAQAPDTEIYLAPIARHGDSLVVGRVENVTRRAGYDNQPFFLPDGSALLYTAIGGDGQADVWRYELSTRISTRVTATPESEYSPTVMPGGSRFSVIRVERDSAQRLWSFAMDGSDPRLVLPALAPVGYHAWLNASRLVTYVLGAPSTLHLVSLDGATDEVRARDVGRAVHRVPGRPLYSYTQRDTSGALWIVAQEVSGASLAAILRAPADNEFHAWTPDGVLLSASNGVLLRWSAPGQGTFRWLPTARLDAFGVKNVSRLAVSADGKWLAFVAEPVSPTR